jgi:beta-1,4-N-acetylglucosaminyltransferase
MLWMISRSGRSSTTNAATEFSVTRQREEVRVANMNAELRVETVASVLELEPSGLDNLGHTMDVPAADGATTAGPVMLVSSSGGHLAQLYRLRQWWETRDRVWVTFPLPDARSLLAGEHVEWAHHPTTRNAKNAILNLGLAIKLVRRYRPSLVVSDGAGVAVPFFVAAKMFGAGTIYTEVFDRIDTRTMTGRLCYPLSDVFLLQWEEQRAMYPRGTVIGPLL